MSSIWVFGYGSLIWNPGFGYSQSMIGHIKGFNRRFYQGSEVHRGTPHQKGRVVTLLEDSNAHVWGKAYMLKDTETALQYLNQRESSIGGYTTISTVFYPRDPREQPFTLLVYIALPSNPLFLGHGPSENLAKDIAFSRGVSGHNVEYLAKLVAFMKIELPYVVDEHLMELEGHVKQLIQHEKHVYSLFEEAVDHILQISSSSNTSSSSSGEIVKQFDYDSDAEDNDNEIAMLEAALLQSPPTRKMNCSHKF